MKTLKTLLLATTLFTLSSLYSLEQPQEKTMTAPLKVGIVNFATCVESSKLGKQEQDTFDAMKKQMENILLEKEKVITDIANKLSDEDYLDSLSPEKETDIKRQYRALGQELTQIQTQYYQTLQQANLKIIQKIADTIAKASEKVAEQHKYNLLINKDSAFYHAPELDVSAQVIKEMDLIFEQEAKAAPAPATAPIKK